MTDMMVETLMAKPSGRPCAKTAARSGKIWEEPVLLAAVCNTLDLNSMILSSKAGATELLGKYNALNLAGYTNTGLQPNNCLCRGKSINAKNNTTLYPS